MQTDDLNQQKYKKILPYLNEKQTRIVLAAEAESMGRGGLSKVSKLTGISRVTLNMGIKELAQSSTEEKIKNERIRKSGGGRKKATEKNKHLAKISLLLFQHIIFKIKQFQHIIQQTNSSLSL